MIKSFFSFWVAILGILNQNSWSDERHQEIPRTTDFGVCTFELNKSLSQRQQCEHRLRRFIWEHWSKQRKATARAIRYSKEGDKSELIYVIQKADNTDRWIVKIDINREIVDRKRSDGSKIKTSDSLIATNIALIPQKKSGKEKLQLKNKDGEVLQEF
jgi:hypothetical protein